MPPSCFSGDFYCPSYEYISCTYCEVKAHFMMSGETACELLMLLLHARNSSTGILPHLTCRCVLLARQQQLDLVQVQAKREGFLL